MRRREFIALISGAVALPVAGRTQQSEVHKIGVLVAGSPNPRPIWDIFRKALADLGYVEGKNIQFEFRSADGDRTRLNELANDLVRLKVDVIVTWPTPTVTAAKQATRKTPIVMADSGDPVGTGLIASLARPGGNVTGMAGVTAELAGKSVELIRDLIPSTKTVAALCNGPDPFSKPFLEQIMLGGGAAGIAIRPIILSSNEELDAAFLALSKEQVDAVIVQPSLPTRRAAELAVLHRLPATSVPRWFAEEGGLMSYSAQLADTYKQAATYVDKILRGVKPADLPVEQPTKYELIINLRTARALGITVPPAMLARADEVIE